MTNNFIDTVTGFALTKIEQFFQDPKNQADFEKWLATRDENIGGESVTRQLSQKGR